MSSEEKDMDLPVAAETWFDPEEKAYKPIGNSQVELRSGDKLVIKSVAEEAIKEARQQERQKILNRIEEMKTRISQRIDSDWPFTPLKIRTATLADLHDELEEEVE